MASKRKVSTSCGQTAKKIFTGKEHDGLLLSHFRLLEGQLDAAASPEKRIPMEAYLKNQFPMKGIQSTPRREIYNSFRSNVFKPQCEIQLICWVELLWSQPYREYHYIALDELEKSKKLIGVSGALMVESLVSRASWWDTVDMLASKILGTYYLKHVSSLENRVQEWRCSADMWLNRTAILVQLKFKDATRLDLLESAIIPHLQSSEFFLQKAIGWALRELSKTNRDWVHDFITQRCLKPLSRREASKYL